MILMNNVLENKQSDKTHAVNQVQSTEDKTICCFKKWKY